MELPEGLFQPDEFMQFEIFGFGNVGLRCSAGRRVRSQGGIAHFRISGPRLGNLHITRKWMDHHKLEHTARSHILAPILHIRRAM